MRCRLPCPRPRQARIFSDIVAVFVFSETKVRTFARRPRRPAPQAAYPPDCIHPARKADTGEVAEWSNVPDSKSGVRFPRTVGSNPTLSASWKSKGVQRNPENPHQLRLCGFFIVRCDPTPSIAI